MPPIVLRCPDANCGVLVQTSQMLAGLACPRCRRIFRPVQRPTAVEATAGQSPPLTMRCCDAACALIVRAVLSPGERLTCPRCRGALAAVAPPAPAAANPLPGSSSSPDVTLPLPAGTPSTASTPSALRSTEDKLPSWIGRFEIRRFLGEGGFGRVYEAYDPALKRQVALKVPRSEQIQTPERVRRFLGEAQSAAKLMHSHVVAVFDSGQDGPHHYIAMAYVSGQPLNQALRQKPGGFGLREAAEIVRKLAEALAYAHHEGVIHRDVKPGNVMLRDDGEPMLMDFGLAARLEAGEERLTQGQVVMGTPAYVAPEQCKGEAVAASDQYSLGVTLYELLTGQLPFSGGSAAHLMVLHETQPPPSPRKFRSDLPRDLEAICLRCLEKEPARRYSDCQALADDLKRWAAGETVQARLAGPAERLVKWARRHPAVARLTALATALLIAGTTVSTVLAFVALAQAARADREAADAKKEASRADNEAIEARRLAIEAGRLAREEEKARKTAEDKEKLAKEETYRAESSRHALQLDQALRIWEDGDGERVRSVLDAVAAPFQDVWEQRFVRALAPRREPLFALSHKESIAGVAASADGQWIVSAGDTKLTVWDARTWKVKRVIDRRAKDGHVAISADGKRIVSGSGDRVLKIWDVQTGEVTATFDSATTSPTVAMSEDGNQVVFSSAKNLIVADAVTGKAKVTLEGHSDFVTCVALSADGKRIVSGGGDRTVKTWDALTGKLLLSLEGHKDPIWKLAVSADGTRIVTSDLNPEDYSTVFSGSPRIVRVWDGETAKQLLAVRAHTGVVTCVAISRDGKRIATAGTDRTIKILDAQTGLVQFALRAGTDLVAGRMDLIASLAFASDGKRLVSGGLEGVVKVWDANAGGALENQTLRPEARDNLTLLLAAALSPDGNRIVAALDSGLWGWDVQAKKARRISTSRSAINGVTMSLDGKRVVCGDSSGTLRLFDGETWNALATWKLYNGAIHKAAISADGKHVVAGCNDGTMKVLDGQTGRERYSVRAHTRTTSGVAISSDGKWIATGGGDNLVKVWDLETGQQQFELSGHTGPLLSVAFSKDGKLLVSGGADRTPRVWDVRARREKLTLKGHADVVTSVAFSPDGKRIVSGSGDEIVKVWDAEIGHEKLSLKGHLLVVMAVAWSADGRRIMSASADGAVKLWDAPPAVK